MGEGRGPMPRLDLESDDYFDFVFPVHTVSSELGLQDVFDC